MGVILSSPLSLVWMEVARGVQSTGDERPRDHLAVGSKARRECLTLPFSAPTRSIELAPSLVLHFLMVQPVVSHTCLGFSVYPSFSVLEVSPGLRVVGAKRRLVPWIMQ